MCGVLGIVSRESGKRSRSSRSVLKPALSISAAVSRARYLAGSSATKTSALRTQATRA
jgi:hypothetical protein